jgi:hypothetical protein
MPIHTLQEFKRSSLISIPTRRNTLRQRNLWSLQLANPVSLVGLIQTALSLMVTSLRFSRRAPNKHFEISSVLNDSAGPQNAVSGDGF